MSRARARLALSAALAALVLGALPATAGTAEKPELVDQAGDANFANSQGFGNIIGDESLVTPVQADSADLLAMWLETTFLEVTEVIGDDEVVTKVATGLRWNVRTSAPASPSFGPTVLFRMPLTFGGCNAFLESQVRGPASNPTDVERATLRLLTADACGGPVRTLSSPEFTQTFDGDVMSVEFPFSATEGQLRDGLRLAANGAGHVRTVLVAATAPAIDEAPGNWSFQIGKDL